MSDENENPNGYPEELLNKLAESVRQARLRIGHYAERPAMTVRDLILTLTMFDLDAEVIVDDIGGGGCGEPPVVRMTPTRNRPDVVEILTPGVAMARDKFSAGG